MKRTISALLCAGLIAITFTACSSADSFSDKENLSKNVETAILKPHLIIPTEQLTLLRNIILTQAK